jgi:molybdate/tungstate transport system ATP-binding protein
LIEIRDLSIHQGAFALSGVSLQIATGRYGVLMGKTGCGKTSLLEAIAGLRPIASGQIVLGNRDVTGLSPGERGSGYVPQDAALFRTMTVYNHLAFALRIRNVRKTALRNRVVELAAWLGISELLQRRTRGLSGGEMQRVALGRALSFRPSYLLLDEPLSSLDEETRDSMIELLSNLKKLGGVTVLHVTHSRSEAERLADVRFRLVDGKVISEG